MSGCWPSPYSDRFEIPADDSYFVFQVWNQALIYDASHKNGSFRNVLNYAIQECVIKIILINL